MVNLVQNKEIVKLGSTVTIKINGQKYEYTIVADGVADISKGEISQSSPIGKAILGYSLGDEVKIDLPEGRTVRCKIVKIR